MRKPWPVNQSEGIGWSPRRLPFCSGILKFHRSDHHLSPGNVCAWKVREPPRTLRSRDQKSPAEWERVCGSKKFNFNVVARITGMDDTQNKPANGTKFTLKTPIIIQETWYVGQESHLHIFPLFLWLRSLPWTGPGPRTTKPESDNFGNNTGQKANWQIGKLTGG